MDRPKSVVGVIRGVAQTVHVSHLFIGSSSGTEYFVSFPTKTGSSPLTLLKQFVTLTGQKIRYLRIDGVKEFQSDKIKAYCAENDVVLQLICIQPHYASPRRRCNWMRQQHSRTSMLHANKSTRFWDDATKDFNIKKVYLWASPDTHGKLETPHDRMQLAFFRTYKTVAVPFCS